MQTPLRVIFVNRFFHPDHSATSQLLSDLAFFLARRGWQVHVITSRLRYDNPVNPLPARETVQGVQVMRVWSTRFGRSGVPGRLADYLSFYLASAWAAFALARSGDLVVAKTDPPMLSAIVGPVVWLRRAILITWLQDVFPEVAAALGLALAQGMPGRMLARWRDATLRLAAVNVVIGEGMAIRLRNAVPAIRVQVIPNWVDDAIIKPLRALENPLRNEWGLIGKFVVGYSGNMGRAHSLAPILRAAVLLRSDPNVVFLLIGDGTGRLALEAEARATGLVNVIFKPYQPRERLGLTLTLPDVHLVSLKPELEDLIVPSKAYGVLAAGRPMIFMGLATGEIGSMVVKAGCGVVVPENDGESLASSIRHLGSNAPECEAMGRRARLLLEADFSQAASLAAWETIVKNA